jgi:hypothetical protein
MCIVLCSQKVVSAPAGRHMPAQMSLLTELTSFSWPELYTFRAAGASQMPNPQNPVRSANLKSQISNLKLNIHGLRSPATERIDDPQCSQRRQYLASPRYRHFAAG